MTDEQIKRFHQALDGLLGLTNPAAPLDDPQSKAALKTAEALQQITFEEELVIPASLRQRWIEKARLKTAKPSPFLHFVLQRAGIGLLIGLLALLIGFYQPVLAAVGQAFGYIYVADVGFLPRSTTRLLEQAVRQQHEGQSVTVTQGVSTPEETILFLEYNDIARPVDGAWLELTSGEHLALKSWRYFPDRPASRGVQLFFPPLPQSVDQTTLALKEGWRLPLRWIFSAHSFLPDVRIIPYPESSSTLPSEQPTACVEKNAVQLCVLAAATGENTSVLVSLDFLDSVFRRSDLGITWQTETQAVQLITDEGEHVSLLSEQQDTLLFPPQRAGQKVTLSIPAVVAQVDIPDQIITIPLGDDPQANDSIPLDASVQIMDATVHFSKAVLIGDGVTSLRLTLIADKVMPSASGLTPLSLDVGKPDNVDDLYGSGLLSGGKAVFVELMRPAGKISGEIAIPILSAAVMIQGPFEFEFTLPDSSTPSQNAVPTPAQANPLAFTPVPTSTPLSLYAYRYSGAKIQANDFLYTIGDGEQSKVFLIQPGASPRELVSLPGAVSQAFVHPDHLGMDVLLGESQTKDGFSYIDQIRLLSLRFDQPLPRFLYTFPPNLDNLVGTAINGTWSFDGQVGLFRLPNTAPGAGGWRYLWIDLNCRQSASCAAQELALPSSLDLYAASFAPSDYRILFTGADYAGSGKTDFFLLDFHPAEPASEIENLTSAYSVGDGITPAQWTKTGQIFSVCSPHPEGGEASAFCWLDPQTGALIPLSQITPVQDGMRLYGNYWVSQGGKYLAALFVPSQPGNGEIQPTLRLIGLEDGKVNDLGFAQNILSAAFSADERYLAVVEESSDETKLILVDILNNSSETILSVRKPSALTGLGWVR